MESNTTSGHIYKLDKFVVPDAARDEFLPKVFATMKLLESQPGYIQGFTIEQPSNSGEFNLVTFIEWDSKQATEFARAAVTAMHEASGFNPQEAMARLSVRAEMGFYTASSA